MSLREELEARFAELERQEQIKQQTQILNTGQRMLSKQEPNVWDKVQSTVTPIAVGTQGFAQGVYEAGQNMGGQLYQGGKDIGNAFAQSQEALSSLIRNYILMKSHNFKKLDDYYHCKGNYQATKAGTVGNLTANFLGSAKEGFDYFKNRYYKGLSMKEALEDANHDLYINQIGRDCANDGVNYFNASEACKDFRNENLFLPLKYY